MRILLSLSSALLFLVALAGCGGSKVLKEPEPLVVTQSLANAADETVSVTLDWVIVRDGPGAWAENVDWDEYLIRVRNLSGESIRVIGFVVIDSLGTRIDIGINRKTLVKGSKQTKRRYKGEGLTVQAGASVGTLMVAGAVTGAAAMSVGAAAVFSSTALAGAAVGGLILAPVLAVGGVLRGVNNSRVNSEIESRQTTLPVELQKGEEKNFDLFFPLSPSPLQLEVTYGDSQGNHRLIIDTRAALDGLHLVRQTR